MTDAAQPDLIDLCIVGAGPAGAASAIEAIRAGLTAVVVDKATFPREKCCGDGLTAGALRVLEELGLDPGTVPSWKVVQDVVVTGPSGRAVTYKLPAESGQYAAVARRVELDDALVQLARSKGAEIREAVSVEAVCPSDGHISVQLSDGTTIAARYVIAADGMWSTVRKSLGLGMANYRGDWHAFRQYFTDVNPEATSGLYVWFEPDITPGYVWSFPLGDGTANVGFGIQRDKGIAIQEMKDLWPDLLKRPHIAAVLGADAKPEGPHRAWPIPARLGKLALTGPRTLFVGDAATATDPMTGEGIGQALETGIEAVLAVAAGGTEMDVRNRYERGLRKTMVKDHGLARALSAALGNNRLADAAIAFTGLTDWTRRNFARWLFEDYPRAVLSTPRRWSRKMFASPGAYQR